MMRILLFFSVLLIAACSSNSNSKYQNGYGAEVAPSVYTVSKGDTLFSISWRYGLDLNQVMQKNGIVNPNKILVGQKLNLISSSSSYSSSASDAPSSVEVVKRRADWVWPMKGRIIRRFSAGGVGANGLRLSGKPKQSVNAAESGIVVYKGNGLKGYGNVVIIKHDDNLLSAYGFLSKTYVKNGQKVRKRQKIGTVGYGPNSKLMLHFEVRRNGKPANPVSYIGHHYHF